MLGNNQKSSKVKRLLITLDPGKYNTSIFLPEDPELERVNITGISVSFSAGNFGDISRDTPYFSGSDSVKIVRDNSNAAKKGYLTLYADDNSVKLDNFPLQGLYDRTSANKQRVIPVSGKIKVKQSYIFIPGRLATIVGTVECIYLNFYYN